MLFASPVTLEKAQAIAAGQMRAVLSSRQMAPGRMATPSLAMKAVAAGEAAADYYVFNNGSDAGYVVVAGDDRAPAVLAYSDRGTFDPDNIPDAMRYVLDGFAARVAALRHSPTLAEPALAPRDHEVKPLLTCNWSQNAPYNDLCPTYVNDKGETGRCATGCAVTAVAQIMYYHKWPKQGTGSNSYECQVNGKTTQTLSADFASTTYRWDDMLDSYSGSYTQPQGNAVATLMYHLGVAAKANYGVMSGANPYRLMMALNRNFGYSKDMRMCFRRAMTTADWENLLYGEVDAKRPVFLTGYSDQAGHSFVLDGYDRNGYFHINWGWGAACNGYFLITWLNPEDKATAGKGYNTTLYAVVGICPDNGQPEPAQHIEAYANSWYPTVYQANLGTSIPVDVKDFTLNGHGYLEPLGVSLMVCLTDVNGNHVEEYNEDNVQTNTLSVGELYDYSGAYGMSYTSSPSTPDGEYYLWLLYKCDKAGVTEYSTLTCAPREDSYYRVTVKDGVMYIYKPSRSSKLQATKCEFPARVGTLSSVKLNATVHNNGDEYRGNINYVITPKDQPSYINVSAVQAVAIAPATDIVSQQTIVAPDAAGDYSLWVMDDNNNVIGGPYDLKVELSADYLLNITRQIAPTSYTMPSGQVTATVELSNTGTGNFVGNLPYMIANENATYIQETGLSDIVEIPAGQKVTVNISSTFEGEPGFVYQISLGKLNSDENDMWGDSAPFQIKSETPTGVDDIDAESIGVTVSGHTITVTGARAVTVYNLAGALVATGPVATLPAGIYIVVADGTARKFAVK